jgi:hypothetical protein
MIYDTECSYMRTQMLLKPVARYAGKKPTASSIVEAVACKRLPPRRSSLAIFRSCLNNLVLWVQASDVPFVQTDALSTFIAMNMVRLAMRSRPTLSSRDQNRTWNGLSSAIAQFPFELTYRFAGRRPEVEPQAIKIPNTMER